MNRRPHHDGRPGLGGPYAAELVVLAVLVALVVLALAVLCLPLLAPR